MPGNRSEILAHEVTLLTAENRTLRKTNKALSNAIGLKSLVSVKKVHLL